MAKHRMAGLSAVRLGDISLTYITEIVTYTCVSHTYIQVLDIGLQQAAGSNRGVAI